MAVRVLVVDDSGFFRRRVTEMLEADPSLKVVGTANNQLSSSNVGDWLHKNGILYVPDYVANAGGLINVVD